MHHIKRYFYKNKVTSTDVALKVIMSNAAYHLTLLIKEYEKVDPTYLNLLFARKQLETQKSKADLNQLDYYIHLLQYDLFNLLKSIPWNLKPKNQDDMEFAASYIASQRITSPPNIID